MDDKKANKEYVKGLISGLLVSVIVIIAFVAAWYIKVNRLYYKYVKMTSSTVEASGMKFDSKEFDTKLDKMTSYVKEMYLNKIDETKLVDGAFKGIMESLGDPYSGYYTSDEYKKILESTSGEYKGIGVSVTVNEAGEVVISKVFEDTPAKKAGLQENDIIAKVDGTDVTGKDLEEVVSLIKKNGNAEVTIQVRRNTETLDIKLKCEKIKSNTVASKMMENDTGYIMLTEFDGVSTNQFAEALNSLESQGMKKLIIDVRDNPGGRLDVVCDILDLFVDKDKLLVYTKDKYGEGEKQISKYKASIKDIPICILVNGNSASAAELFTGVMKDYKLATIVGTKTFGKGIVQQIVSLGDGSAIKITVSKYYLPKNENIHGKGITPDKVVELPNNAATVSSGVEDTQLEKALEILNK